LSQPGPSPSVFASARDGVQKFLPQPALSRWKMFLYPTWYGLVYLGMVFALLVGSINHNNNLGYLLTFLLVGILLVSIRLGFANLRGILPLGSQAPAVFAGRTARFAIHLATDAGARHGLTLALDPAYPITVDLAGDNPTTVALPFAATRRGELRFTALQLATSYPLGLVTWTRRLPLDLACTVYPQPLPVIAAGQGGGNQQEQPGQLAGTGRDFSGLAHYQPGDSPQQIHWKSFAAGKGLHSKFFTEESSGGTLFSLESLPEASLETRLSWLCHLLVTAEAGGLRYGLRLGEQLFPLDRGAAHRHRCLSALALYR
jgi:uncharacterized protein (DUF58 family)